MKIFNKNDIKVYLKDRCGDNLPLRHLLWDCLLDPLRFETDYLRPIKSPEELPNSRTRHKFRASAEPWLMFEPTKQLDMDVDRVTRWIEEFLNYAGSDYCGTIRIDARQKMKLIQSVSEALRKTNQRVLTDEEYNDAFQRRLIRKDEKDGHVEHISRLHGRCELYRISTKRGMEIAGRKADNCLGNSRMPDGSVPLKKLVESPESYQFYSVRGPEGESLITIGVDIQFGRVWAHSNGKEFPPPPVPDHLYHLKSEAVEIIHQRLPELAQNRPYGTQPYL